MVCKIETVEIETSVENGDYIIATAKDICTILSGRIVRWQLAYSGLVHGFIYELLSQNALHNLATPEQRQIPNLFWGRDGLSELTDTIDVSAVTEDLLQLIMTTCKTYNYGFRVTLNLAIKELTFRLYKGKNKANTQSEQYVEFSPSFANISGMFRPVSLTISSSRS